MAVPEHGGLAKRRQQRLLTSGELFVKKYRTEIAASASSCVSTFIAVSYFALITIRHRDRKCKIYNSVKLVSPRLRQDAHASVSYYYYLFYSPALPSSQPPPDSLKLLSPLNRIGGKQINVLICGGSGINFEVFGIALLKPIKTKEQEVSGEVWLSSIFDITGA
jgi:hypothetical protein